MISSTPHSFMEVSNIYVNLCEKSISLSNHKKQCKKVLTWSSMSAMQHKSYKVSCVLCTSIPPSIFLQLIYAQCLVDCSICLILPMTFSFRIESLRAHDIPPNTIVSHVVVLHMHEPLPMDFVSPVVLFHGSTLPQEIFVSPITLLLKSNLPQVRFESCIATLHAPFILPWLSMHCVETIFYGKHQT